ncbi:MAG: hypothetical protein LUG46_01655 [Erysipelotrichaceae bacterium]|nr:hypothetical protein [Erysipelotrichaceae bacterium]
MPRKAPRAQMFQPYDALVGFRDLIKEQEKVVVDHKELTEYDCEILNQTVYQIEVGMMIKVVYRHQQEYIQVEGIVSKINFDTRMIQIVKKRLNLQDLVEIEIL